MGLISKSPWTRSIKKGGPYDSDLVLRTQDVRHIVWGHTPHNMSDGHNPSNCMHCLMGDEINGKLRILGLTWGMRVADRQLTVMTQGMADFAYRIEWDIKHGWNFEPMFEAYFKWKAEQNS